jgi:hypothetical protein
MRAATSLRPRCTLSLPIRRRTARALRRTGLRLLTPLALSPLSFAPTIQLVILDDNMRTGPRPRSRGSDHVKRRPAGDIRQRRSSEMALNNARDSVGLALSPLCALIAHGHVTQERSTARKTLPPHGCGKLAICPLEVGSSRRWLIVIGFAECAHPEAPPPFCDRCHIGALAIGLPDARSPYTTPGPPRRPN